MKTEILTTDTFRPIRIKWDGKYLVTQEQSDYVEYNKSETILIRDFLNQLNLQEGKEG